MEKIILRCPICGQKTHTHVQRNTVLLHFPLYCPKCRRESLVDVRGGRIVRTGEGSQDT